MTRTHRCVKRVAGGRLLDSQGAQRGALRRPGGTRAGRETRGRGDAGVLAADSLAQQTLTQHCKAAILQLRKSSNET